MSAPIRKMQTKFTAHKFLKKLLTYRCYSSVRRSICDLFSTCSEIKNVPVSTEGWMKSLRKQKNYTFFHLNDGTSSENLQVVADSNICDSSLSVGCSVRVNGELVESKGKGQAVELQARSIEILGQCDNDQYPFKPKSSYTLDYARQHLHLRPRTEHHIKLLQLRNVASLAVHKHFQDQGYLFIHTPIITSNDCEGAGETFHVKTDPAKQITPVQGSDSELTECKKHFFGHPAFLTVSGQLHLEAVAGAFRKVYNFGPTFRAENSMGRHHLSEFYMIEAEIAFTETLEDIMKEMESLVKGTCREMMNKSEELVNFFWKDSIVNDQNTVSRQLIEQDYIRMTYTDAVKVLQENNAKFEFKVKWGSDFQKEHEKFLVKHCNNTPVFVTDFPSVLKPFYARRNINETTVAAVDLLVPEVGELFGGSLREERYDVIKSRLDNLGFGDTYRWYLDLRQYGSVPHGGFGMGFERLLQCFLGITNIKDTIPFPRWPQHCSL